MTLESKPIVSVVIPTCRRDDLLARCLDGVLSQDLESAFEVIVVDDANSATTAGVIGAAQARHPGSGVELIAGHRAGPAVARNLGWRAARADLIAFIDDDAFPATTDWLANGLAPFLDDGVAAVAGTVRVPTPEVPDDYQRNVRNLESADFVTCNAFCRRAALELVNGFDERFTVPYREDSDLQFRIEEHAGRIAKAPAAIVVHPAPAGKFGVSMRLQRYSMFNALLYREHGPRYRREIQRMPPLDYYATVLLAVAAVVALATGGRRRSALAGAAWLAFYLRFFVRRANGAVNTPKHLTDMAITSAAIPFLSIFWRLRGALRFRVFFF